MVILRDGSTTPHCPRWHPSPLSAIAEFSHPRTNLQVRSDTTSLQAGADRTQIRHKCNGCNPLLPSISACSIHCRWFNAKEPSWPRPENFQGQGRSEQWLAEMGVESVAISPFSASVVLHRAVKLLILANHANEGANRCPSARPTMSSMSWSRTITCVSLHAYSHAGIPVNHICSADEHQDSLRVIVHPLGNTDCYESTHNLGFSCTTLKRLKSGEHGRALLFAIVMASRSILVEIFHGMMSRRRCMLETAIRQPLSISSLSKKQTVRKLGRQVYLLTCPEQFVAMTAQEYDYTREGLIHRWQSRHTTGILCRLNSCGLIGERQEPYRNLSTCQT